MGGRERPPDSRRDGGAIGTVKAVPLYLLIEIEFRTGDKT
jgi:hypothetical protein